MFFIPLYFQIIKNATPGEAGGYMIPSIAGNTVGGLIAGVLVKKYGRTKWILIGSAISAGICFTLLLLFWRGNTPIWQSLFVFPGGFATAVAHSVAFVAVAVRVEDDEMAIAASGLYLAGSVGAVAGLSAASAFFQTCLRSSLKASLSGYPDGAEVSQPARGTTQMGSILTCVPGCSSGSSGYQLRPGTDWKISRVGGWGVHIEFPGVVRTLSWPQRHLSHCGSYFTRESPEMMRKLPWAS